MMRVPILAVMLGLLAVPALGADGPARHGAPWTSEHHVDHPLVGRIWLPASGDFIAADALVERLHEADHVLLGEIHDNPDHHRLQAELVAALGPRGRHEAVVFEMIDAGRAATVDEIDPENPPSLPELADSLDWADSGWPDWSLYEPVFAATLAHGFAIRAGDLDGDLRRRIGRGGLDALPDNERERLGLNDAFADSQRRSILATLEAAHCGLMTGASLEPMLAVQRARDAALADAMLGNRASILIAGSGHIRKDRAVPRFIARRSPASTAFALAFVEVDPSAVAPDDYLPADAGTTGPVFDAIWFTPRGSIVDHCAALRERFRGRSDDDATRP